MEYGVVHARSPLTECAVCQSSLAVTSHRTSGYSMTYVSDVTMWMIMVDLSTIHCAFDVLRYGWFLLVGYSVLLCR